MTDLQRPALSRPLQTVDEPTPLEATATPPVGSATGATARVCESGGRGAIKLSGAAAAALARGAQATRKH